MGIAVRSFPRVEKVDYWRYRKQIRSGDLLLCSGETFFSKVIRNATKSTWSHVAFVLWLPHIDRLMVLESVESVGVRAVPFSHYVRDYKGGKGYPGRLLLGRHRGFANVQPQQLGDMSQFAVDQLGYPYDRDEIVKIGGRILAGQGRHKRDREYICSEYARECYAQVGIDFPLDRRGFIAPSDLAKAKGVSAVCEIKVVKG